MRREKKLLERAAQARYVPARICGGQESVARIHGLTAAAPPSGMDQGGSFSRPICTRRGAGLRRAWPSALEGAGLCGARPSALEGAGLRRARPSAWCGAGLKQSNMRRKGGPGADRRVRDRDAVQRDVLRAAWIYAAAGAEQRSGDPARRRDANAAARQVFFSAETRGFRGLFAAGRGNPPARMLRRAVGEIGQRPKRAASRCGLGRRAARRQKWGTRPPRKARRKKAQTRAARCGVNSFL